MLDDMIENPRGGNKSILFYLLLNYSFLHLLIIALKIEILPPVIYF